VFKYFIESVGKLNSAWQSKITVSLHVPYLNLYLGTRATTTVEICDRTESLQSFQWASRVSCSC